MLGKVSAEDVIKYFNDALATSDLETKRTNMLIGASFATFSCEMSIEESDEIAKAPYDHDKSGKSLWLICWN